MKNKLPPPSPSPLSQGEGCPHKASNALLNSRLERIRHALATPVALSVSYLLGGLVWLLMANPLLVYWLHGETPSPLLHQAPNIMAVLASAALLYWLMKALEKPTHCALETHVRERTAELLTINQALEQQIAACIQMEFALRDSEERFRQLVDHIRDVFWVYGVAEERLIYVSPAYEDVWGRPIDALHERPMEWIEAIHPDDRPRVETALRLAQQALGHFDEEFRLLRPDGTIRWIWSRGFPVHDETAYVYRIAGLAEDITTRKLADDRLRRQQVELSQMSRLSLAVELASNLAHELNQPLAAIVAYTQACLALLRQPRTDPRELTGTLDEVINQGLRAGEIIRHLRDLVRKHPAAQSALDLNALIHSVLHYAQLELRQAKVLLTLELANPLPTVLADEIQIQLVVLYLMRNAVDAMPATQEEPRQLTLCTAVYDTQWVLTTIRDTGHGFNPDLTERLFQPFYTTKPGNMGLGLTVSRSIIESQGGQLWATLNPERGASFHFTLPIHPHDRFQPMPV